MRAKNPGNENPYQDFKAEKQIDTVLRILSRDPAGVYPNMTDDTKNLYLSLVLKKAKKEKIPAEKYAQLLLDKAMGEKQEKKQHIGYPLFTASRAWEYAYYTCFFGFAALSLLLLCLASPLCLLALPCVWKASRYFCSFLFSKFKKSTPTLRMNISQIPDGSAVLVVINSLLTGKKSDDALFERLELIYRSNGGRNIYFGVLCDLADFSSANAPGDENILNYAYGRIDSLNKKYGNCFILFERRRSYSKTEEAFMGWERKRGAVVELVRFLCGKETTFNARSLSLAKDILGDTNIKYVVTLDADTNLPLDAVKDMYSCMLHPLYKPEIDRKKGIVISGHAIMYPSCETELCALSRSHFSRIFCKNTDDYENGIFDVITLSEVIDKNRVLPEDCILEHGRLYSAKLASHIISDIKLYRSFPKDVISYLHRHYNKVRGDIQNLRFIFPAVSINSNNGTKNGFSRTVRFKLLESAAEGLLPCSAFICVFTSVFTSAGTRTALLLGALGYIFLPAVIDFFTSIFKLSARSVTGKFLTRGVNTGLWQNILKSFFTLSMLAQETLVSFDAITRSLYRMLISKRHLLEYRENVQNDGAANLLTFVHKNIFSAFAGFLLFAFANGGFLRFIALLWLAFPVIAYHTSFCKDRTRDEKSTEEASKEYAADIWRFFENHVGSQSNHLPPESLQLLPYEKALKNTSPASIGFYLLSVLCSRDFGFITTGIMQEKISATVSNLERMKKWNGHFFSAYNTENLSATPPFLVSTLDSAVLTACIITLKAGLREYVFESTSLIELITRLEKIEASTDYSLLYNKERKLFSRGAAVNENGSYTVDSECFELIMSESRLLSYIECARRNVPKSHWQELSRDIVSSGGYIGLASRFGSASEYFLPSVFLPLCKGSLFYETSLFALRAQRNAGIRTAHGAVFGVSKSAYNAFDSEMNYRQKAFGIPSLSLFDNKENDIVISPYSSFISLCTGKSRVFANLENMRRNKYYGKYGFYDAIDFTPGRSEKNGTAVKCYSASHLGISFASLCNAAFDNILCARFMSNSDMACARSLLEEKIPVDVVLKPRFKN